MKKLIISLLLILPLSAHAEEYRIYLKEPQIQWTSYIKMWTIINEDRIQTLSFQDRGIIEQNPLLGQNPSKIKINTLIATTLLVPFILKDLPPFWQQTIAESIAFTEETIVNENNMLFNNDPSWKPQFPIAIRMIWTF